MVMRKSHGTWLSHSIHASRVVQDLSKFVLILPGMTRLSVWKTDDIEVSACSAEPIGCQHSVEVPMLLATQVLSTQSVSSACVEYINAR